MLTTVFPDCLPQATRDAADQDSVYTLHGLYSKDAADMQPLALAAEDSDVEQSWPGLFWLPPVVNEPRECDMLRLDDELASLIEAADTSADQDRTHSMKPAAAASMLGQDSLTHRSSRLLCAAV